MTVATQAERPRSPLLDVVAALGCASVEIDTLIVLAFARNAGLC